MKSCRTREPGSQGTFSFSFIEELENRTLFSAPYEVAGVGFRFDGNAPRVMEILGTLQGDQSFSGTQTAAGVSGTPVTGPVDWATLELLTRGRLTTTPSNGVTPYDAQVGGIFGPDRGFPIGSLSGTRGSGSELDVFFMIERAAGRTIEWSGMNYEYQYVELSASGTAFTSGVFGADPSGSFRWYFTLDQPEPTLISVDSQDAFGSVILSNGMHLHASPALGAQGFFPTVYGPGPIVLMVDTDNSDGTVGVGIARAIWQFAPYESRYGLQGLYRTSVLTTGAAGAAIFGAVATPGGGFGAAHVALDLTVDGTYRIYDLAGYDAGDRTVVSQGSWDATPTIGSLASFVSLTDEATGVRAHFRLTPDYALLPSFVEDAGGGNREELLGAAATFSTIGIDTALDGAHVALDDNGRPIFYEAVTERPFQETQSHHWRSLDLIDAFGGKTLQMAESRDIEPSLPRYLVVGVATDGDVVSWERSFNGRWIFRNLTEESGGGALASDLTIFEHRARFADSSGLIPTLAVAGKTAAGDLVLYTPDMTQNGDEIYPWTVTNISADGLAPHGESTPIWTGRVQGYQTGWEGENIVGLDENGDLVVVWTAPGLSRWYVTDVSDLAGTPAMTGAISVLMTSWDGIHIHALDEQGALHVTWWVPQFGGDWAHNVLTNDASGPLFDTSRTTDRTEAFTTFIGVGNTLNIVGFDEDGRVRVYWWSPASNVWLVGDLTNSFPVEQAPLGFSSADMQGGMDRNTPYDRRGQSLYGYDADGDFKRVWWAAGGPDAWHIENLTAVAERIEI